MRFGVRNSFGIAPTRAPRDNQISMQDATGSEYRLFSKEEFKPGTIIKAYIHEEDFRGTPQPSSLSSVKSSFNFSQVASSTKFSDLSRVSSRVSFSQYGKPIYTEFRYLIVVATFEDHYMAIPLYTHGGKGLAHKTAKDEYASVEDYRNPNSLKEASWLLRTEFLKPDVKNLLPQSVAHVAYPVPRKYILPVAHQGKLKGESTVCLVELFCQHMLGMDVGCPTESQISK